MQKLIYIGRKPSSSPDAGSHERHHHEQEEIIARALNLSLTELEKQGHASDNGKAAIPSDVEVTEGTPVGK